MRPLSFFRVYLCRVRFILSDVVRHLQYNCFLFFLFFCFFCFLLVEDWDVMEQIWNYAFHSRLRVEPAEHPLFCTEPSWNAKENRHKLAELAFEKFQFPAFFLASDAAMTA